MSDITELSKSVDKLNKTINTLAGATLFSNARMNEMVEASNKVKDNFDDIEENSSETVKNLKNSHKLLKEENSLLLKQNEIDKKNFLLKQKESDIIEKTHKIEELRRKKSSQSNKKRIQELEREVELNKSEQKVLESNYKLSVQELEIQKQQNVESKKATEELKKRNKLMDSISSDFKKLGNNLKNFATGSLAKFFSFGVMIDGAKDLYKESNKVYDSYYSLSLPLQKAEKGMMALVKKTNDYIWATKSIKDYAATYGYDMEKVEPMVNALQAKIKYIKQNAQGKYEWDVEKLADNAKHLISISKLMNMESDDMVGLLEERVRRFGDTDKQAISSMHEMAAATLSFNEIMGQGSVFTEEVGKHLLELHQNTKYWTQDFGMLNTMFNSHVALLLKQGRHQKEALHIARQFQESLQNPPELIKWKAGSKMLAEFKNEIKGLNEEQAISAVQSKWGVDEGTARTAVKAIREGHNTGFTQANILQDLLGGTKRGMQSTIGAWGSFKNFDSTVLRDMGLAQSVGDAEKIKQLIKDIEKNPALMGNNVAEAIDSLVDMEKGLSDEQKEARKKELKALMEANSSKDGEQVQSPFENAVLSTTKQAENWFSNPFVKIAAGSIGALGSVFSNTAGYLLGGILLKSGKSILRGIGRGFKGMRGAMSGSVSKLPSSLSKFGGTVSSPFRKMGADRTYKKFLDAQIKSGHFSGEALESLKAERNSISLRNKFKGFGGKVSNVAKATPGAAKNIGTSLLKKGIASGGGLSAGIGLAAGLLSDSSDNREGITVSNTASIVGGLADIASKLNPWVLGISALGSGIYEALDENGSFIGGAVDSLLSPLDGIFDGTSKMVGKQNALGRVLGSLASGIKDTRRWLTNADKKDAAAIEKKKQREKLSERARNIVAGMTAQRTKSYDAKYAEIAGRYGMSGIDSSNIDSKLAGLEAIYEENLKNTENWTEKEEEYWNNYSQYIEELRKARDAQKTEDILAKDVIKYEELASMSKEDLRKELGKYSSKTSLKEFAESRGFSEGQTEALTKQTIELAKKFGYGQVGNTAAQNEIAFNQAQELIVGRLESAQDEANEYNAKQLAEMEKQAELAKNMENHELKIMEYTMDQTDYLRVLSEKAALDIASDSARYSKYIDKNNPEAIFRTDASGNVTVKYRNFNTSVAQAQKQASSD